VSGIGEAYECANCHGTFTKVIDDEEAMAEYEATWQSAEGPLDIVCDDCYAQIAAWAQLDHPEFLRNSDSS
jgi:hypothetical protein